MRKAVLENHLRRIERFGNTIRIFLSPRVYGTLQELRTSTKRSYHDIIRIVLNVHEHQKKSFKGKIRKKRRYRILNVRLSREAASDYLDLAWRRGTTRSWFLGFLVERFLSLVPKRELTEVLNYQLDRLEQITGGTHVRRKEKPPGQSQRSHRRSHRQGS